MDDDIKQSMNHAEKVETREPQADTAEIEQDTKAVEASRPPRTPPPKTDGFVQVHTIWVTTAVITMGDDAVVAVSRTVAQ